MVLERIERTYPDWNGPLVARRRRYAKGLVFDKTKRQQLACNGNRLVAIALHVQHFDISDSTFYLDATRTSPQERFDGAVQRRPQGEGLFELARQSHVTILVPEGEQIESLIESGTVQDLRIAGGPYFFLFRTGRPILLREFASSAVCLPCKDATTKANRYILHEGRSPAFSGPRRRKRRESTMESDVVVEGRDVFVAATAYNSGHCRGE